MIQYIIIPLADDAVSFCHYPQRNTTSWIDKDVLQKAILFAMKQDYAIQYIYPNRELPSELDGVIKSMTHTKMMSVQHPKSVDADVIVVDGDEQYQSLLQEHLEKAIVLRTDVPSLKRIGARLKSEKRTFARLNIVLTDILYAEECGFETYKTILSDLSDYVFSQYLQGKQPQINVLTDRWKQDKMNNCDAGVNNITMSPDGSFYLCPGFMQYGAEAIVGNIDEGVKIPNQQLLKLDHAPICRVCDAYHCHRCVWMNVQSTLEVNTPSHEQCVMSHLEREASKALLQRLSEAGVRIQNVSEIADIDYLDPFQKVIHEIK